MKFRGKLKSTVAVMFAAGMLATGAHADQLTMGLNDGNGIGDFSVVANHPIESSAGYFDVTNPGKDSFKAFCYELTAGVHIDVTPDRIRAPLDFSSEVVDDKAYTAALFNQFYGTLDMNNATDVAAFQIALWETQDDRDLNAGAYSSWSSSVGVLDKASYYLSGLDTSTQNKYALTVWKNDLSQDIIQAAPVPEPETYAMFAVGLALLGLRRRKA